MLGLGLLLAVGLSACVEVPPGPAYGPQVSVGVSFYQPSYPNMVLVPGYPVYYYPYGNANYFFYDGMYWLYQGDNWYSSSWYNGPWMMSGPSYVPYWLLQVPVRYYRAPPPYFHGWHADQPPHWGEHWGHDWEAHHQGWTVRNRVVPPPAPLPKYQGAYAGNRYPRDRAQQDAIRNQNYRYEPHDSMTRPVSQPPASQPSVRPSYPQQQQEQPHKAQGAPGWQPPPQQRQQEQQQEQPPPQYQPHGQGEWQQRSPPNSAPQSPRPQDPQHEDRSNQSQGHWPTTTTPSQSQPVPGNRQPTTSTPPQTQPYQEQHRESPPPVAGQSAHPAPPHPQTTSSPHESPAPPGQGQAKKSPPSSDTGDDQDDHRR